MAADTTTTAPSISGCDDTSTLSRLLNQAGSTVERLGRVVQAYGTTVRVTGIKAQIGQRCIISDPVQNHSVFADVVGLADGQLILYPLGTLEGISNESIVRVLDGGRSMDFSESMIGCVFDGLGNVLHATDNYKPEHKIPLDAVAPDPLRRQPVEHIFETGVKAIDSMLTVGQGQRLGIFAMAGGGKSTLLSMLARGADADVIVIALIGERGREVREFIEDNLGEQGMARAVVIVSTSDRPAMERVMAAQSATAVAEGFRALGKRVLLLMDSVTRYARALREIGLSVGEPPVRRGFPPSVFAELPRLFERTGNNEHGSITAFYTVLSEDEDGTDPVAEEARSILDGHIVLSRQLGEAGHYPAIDILASTSRLFLSLTSEHQQAASIHIRKLLAKHREIEFLLQMGEYEKGGDALADESLEKMQSIEQLLQQSPQDKVPMATTLQQLAAI